MMMNSVVVVAAGFFFSFLFSPLSLPRLLYRDKLARDSRHSVHVRAEGVASLWLPLVGTCRWLPLRVGGSKQCDSRATSRSNAHTRVSGVSLYPVAPEMQLTTSLLPLRRVAEKKQQLFPYTSDRISFSLPPLCGDGRGTWGQEDSWRLSSVSWARRRRSRFGPALWIIRIKKKKKKKKGKNFVWR